MKATGIVRRIDDLGRVVIPKEIRRTMRIREGDPLEIYTSKDGEVIFKKYSQLGGLSEFAGQICETLYKNTGHAAAVTDRDSVMAVSGIPRRELADRRISPPLEAVMERRQMYQYTENSAVVPVSEDAKQYATLMAAPVVSNGDVMGCVVLLSAEGAVPLDETEYKLLQTISGFLGRYLEN